MTSGMSPWPPNIQEKMSAATPTNIYAPTHLQKGTCTHKYAHHTQKKWENNEGKKGFLC